MRAVRGIHELTSIVRPQMFFHAHDVRDDLAGFLDDDRVADANVFAGDFFDVVQPDAAYRRAGDLHGLEVGRRCERAAFADSDEDVVDPRRGFVLLELVGDQPARRFARSPEAIALVEAIDLEHEAVHFEIELVQPAYDRLAMIYRGGEIVEPLGEGCRGDSPAAH